MAVVSPSSPPGRPAMLSHAAFISADTSATVAFYAGILGMELVAAVLDDKIPSTGEPIPYFHSFFRMGDGSTIAFFEAPELPPPSPDSHPAYATFRHFAMEVDSPELVDEWADWSGGQRHRSDRPGRPRDHLLHLLPRPRRQPARDHDTARPHLERQRGSRPRVARRVGRGQGPSEGDRTGHGDGARRPHPRAQPPPHCRPRRRRPPHDRLRGTPPWTKRASRRSSASTTTSSSRPTCGRPGCPRSSVPPARGSSGAASARSTGPVQPSTRRSSTATRPTRSTPGCTRTSCTRTSAWSQPSATRVKR